MDDLRPPLAFRFRLAGNCPLHFLRQIHVLHLDSGDFHTPGLCLLIDDPLQVCIDLLPLRQQVVELALPQHAAQRRLRHHRRGVQVVFDLDDGSFLIYDAKIDDGVDLDGDVVLRNDVLRRDIHGDGPQTDADQLVDERDDNDDAWTIPAHEPAGQTAPTEDDGPFVLSQHVKAHQHQYEAKDENRKRTDGENHVWTSFFLR